jgi:hypothetical protein
MGCPVCNENRVINAKFCYNCGTKFAIEKDVKHSMFLNSDKGDNFEIGEELGLTGKALANFMYTLYEVRFDGVVDLLMGDFKIDTIYIGDKVYKEYM